MKTINTSVYALLFFIAIVSVVFIFFLRDVSDRCEIQKTKIEALTTQIEIITLKNKEFEDQISALQIMTENNTKSLDTTAKAFKHISTILKVHNGALNMHKESFQNIINILGNNRY